MSTAKILAVDDEADFELSLGNASAARSVKEDSASASPITARKRWQHWRSRRTSIWWEMIDWTLQVVGLLGQCWHCSRRARPPPL